MSKVIDILKQNAELKRQIEDILSLVRENDIKHWGYKVIEYTFLNAKTLDEIDKGPLSHLEEIFFIDHVYLLINQDYLPYLYNEKKFDRVLFYNRKAFEYFYFSKKPYMGQGHLSLTKEFDLFEPSESYLAIPVLSNDNVVASLNFYSCDKGKFGGDFASDFVKDLSIKVSYILQYMNKLLMLEKKLNKNGSSLPYSCDFDDPGFNIFKSEERFNKYTLLIIKFSFSCAEASEILKMIKITKEIKWALSSIGYVDYVIQPFSDIIYLLSAEVNEKKLKKIIKESNEKINSYLSANGIKLNYFIEYKRNGKSL